MAPSHPSFDAADAPPLPATPPPCPFCQSDQVVTTSKAVSDATYWRCSACGQIWNPARLLAFRRRR